MSRASRADASRHREEVVAAAARLLRERGSAAMSIPEVMSAAGLTHGGFYKQFTSKEELTGLAATAAFDELLAMLARVTADSVNTPEARARLLGEYLTAAHRDAPGTGCPATGLAADAARVPAGSPLRRSYTGGVKKTLQELAEIEGQPGSKDEDETRRRAIFDLASMVGALTLARATADHPLSEEILTVVRQALTSRS
jgi:TetR/AcrR family transcriptional regulator, transcriptional repressor for nem operon